MAPPVTVTYAASADYAPENLRPAVGRVFAALEAANGPVAGKSVMLKPNLLFWRKPDDPASVNPAFLLEVARCFRAAGAAELAILELPAMQSVPAILRSMGIDGALAELGVTCADFRRFEPLPTAGRTRFRNLSIASEFRDYDLTVDIAKAKTHAMMTLTLAVKNLFGLISGSDRIGWHLAVGRDFGEFADLLLDIYCAVRPAWCFLDGVVAMEGNGPGSGDPVRCGLVAGAADALALDASSAAVFGVPDLLIVERARARGLLPEFVNAGAVPQISPLRLPDPPGVLNRWGVALPPFGKKLLRQLMLSHPAAELSRCVGCGICADRCPPKAIAMTGGKPRFDLGRCIRCYCCQEHCPKGAITPHASRAMRAAAWMEQFLRSAGGRGR